MIKLYNSLTAGITDLFLALMFTIYLLGLFGHSYENIAEIKYLLFLLICGGYCLVMAFLCFQRAVLFPGDRRVLPKQSPSKQSLLKQNPTKQSMPKQSSLRQIPPNQSLLKQSTPKQSPRPGEAEYRFFSGWLSRPARLFSFFVVLYMCFTIFSALLSEYGPAATLTGSERREGVITICIYCLVGLLIARFYRPALWRHYLFSAAILLFCGIAVLQFFGWNPLGLYPDGYDYYDKNIDYNGAFLSTIGNAGLVSAFLSAAVPFSAFSAAGLWKMGRIKKVWRTAAFLSAAAAFCGAAVLLYSGVQAGMLGLIGSAVLFFPAAAGFSRKKRIVWFLVLSFCAVGFTSFVYWNDDFSMTERDAAGKCGDSQYMQAEEAEPGTLCELHEILHGNFDDSFGSGRIHIYRNVLRLVPERLFFGGGPDTLSLRETEDFRRYDTERKMWIETHIDSAHSEYLNILVNQGIFALGAYLGIVVCAAVFLLRNGGDASAGSADAGSGGGADRDVRLVYDADRDIRLACGADQDIHVDCGAAQDFRLVYDVDRDFRLACGAAAVSWLIQALFSISMYISAPYFWIMLGMLFHRKWDTRGSDRYL